MASEPGPRPAPRGAQAGFTLIEVLIAMIILSIGLLALESMGIGAARMARRADARTTYTAVAADTLEGTLNRIRAGAGQTGTSTYTHASTGAAVTVAVTNQAASSMTLWTVNVKVVPPTSSVLKSSDSVTVTSNALQ